jgi:hypothetical protein
MGDVSAYDLANAPGITSEDLQGYGPLGASVDPTSSFGVGDALGLGALGIGAGLMLGKGETPLPPEFGQMGQMVPGLQSNAQTLFGRGTDLYGQGMQAVRMGQRGELTQPQQAVLNQYRTGLTNQANQAYAAMGRSPTTDTSYIGTTADIDAKVNAMAQQEIQTTLQIGFGELTASAQESQLSLGYSDAAAKILQVMGDAQLKQDQAYSQSLTNMFSTIGKVAGIAIGGAFGGPVGAAAGGAAGGGLGSLFGS